MVVALVALVAVVVPVVLVAVVVPVALVAGVVPVALVAVVVPVVLVAVVVPVVLVAAVALVDMVAALVDAAVAVLVDVAAVLVDVVAVLAWVAVVSTPHQLDLDPPPVALALPQVSQVAFCPLRGLHHLVLELAFALAWCLVLGPAHPPVESCSVCPARLPFCFSSLFPSWASSAWDPSLGSFPVSPSWVSSQVATPWIHPLPHRVQVLGASLVVPPGHQVCFGASSGVEDSWGEMMRLLITNFHPPSSSMGSPSDSSSSLYGSMAM